MAARVEMKVLGEDGLLRTNKQTHDWTLMIFIDIDTQKKGKNVFSFFLF